MLAKCEAMVASVIRRGWGFAMGVPGFELVESSGFIGVGSESVTGSFGAEDSEVGAWCP